MYYTNYTTRIIPVGGVISLPVEFDNFSVDIDYMFLDCNGAFILKADYAELYAVIGSEYGETSTQFGLPDYRGKFLRHAPSGVNVGDYVSDAIIGHTHIIYDNKNDTNGTSTGIEAEQYNPVNAYSSTTSWSGGSETRPSNVYSRYCVRYR